MNQEQKSFLKQLEQRIAQNDLDAKVAWADFYAFEYPQFANSTEIIEKIISYYQQGVADDNVTACVNLGAIYYSGVLVKQDFSQAIKLYQKAADLGDSQALCNLGYCFYYGRDIEVNYQKAFECFLQATLYNNANAIYKLGDMYLDETYLCKNEKMAYTLYRKANNTCCDDPNHLDADISYRLAKCFFYEIGTQKDIFLAYYYIQISEFHYYLKLKDGNDPFAEKLLRKTQRLKDEIQEQIEKAVLRF